MSTTLILLIIALVLILVIIAVIAYWVNKIKQKVSDISRAAFGTSSVLEGIDQMQKDYAGTPKSVAAMTSVGVRVVVNATAKIPPTKAPI